MKLAFTTCAVALTALLTFSTSAYSEVVYRWKDEAGNPVNSDRPPPEGIKYETISTSSSMVHAVDAEQPKAPPAAEAKPEDDKTAEQADPGKPKVEKNPEYCQRAKDNLTALDSNVRIQMRNDKGEVHYLTMEERDAQRKQALDTIKVHCPASAKAH